MRTITTNFVMTNFANFAGMVRGTVVGVGTNLVRILSDARFLLRRLAGPATEDMVAVRVYRSCPLAGRRGMVGRLDRVHRRSSMQQGGSWFESAVNSRF